MEGVLGYRKDTEPFYHSFMYSLVSLLSGIYPFYAMHSLLVTIMLQYIDLYKNPPSSSFSSFQAILFRVCVCVLCLYISGMNTS